MSKQCFCILLKNCLIIQKMGWLQWGLQAKQWTTGSKNFRVLFIFTETWNTQKGVDLMMTSLGRLNNAWCDKCQVMSYCHDTTATNQRPRYRSCDHSWPIRGQDIDHVITLDHSENRIQVMWAFSTNQRWGYRSCDHSRPMRGKDIGHVITLNLSEARI